MKKIVVCGMMLGLLTAVSWAQRGRAPGMPTSTHIPNAGVMSPTPGINPSAIGMPHGGVFPSATTKPNAETTTSKNPSTVRPNATMDPIAPTVGSHTETGAPGRVILPDAHDGPAPVQ